MSESLLQLKKDLKAFAKRCKDFKYTDSALFMFLLCGLLSVNLFSATVTDSNIESQVHQINASISQVRTNFKRVKQENNKLLKGTTIELMQLIEQGDQVVKSPWTSWQFGINFFSNGYNSTYKGRGDKVNKYDEQGGKLNRGNWWETAISTKSNQYGILSQGTSNQTSSSNSRNNYNIDDWGLVKLKSDIAEPIVSIELSASVNPKTVNAIPTPNVAVPNIPKAPNPININPNIPTPPKAPVIEVPVVQPILITPASAPSISAPSLTQLTINLPSTPNVTVPTLGSFATPAVGTTVQRISGITNQTVNYTNSTNVTVSGGQAGVGYVPNGTNSNITTARRADNMYSSTNEYGNGTKQSMALIYNGSTGTINVNGSGAVGFFLQPDLDKDPNEIGNAINTTLGTSTYGDRDNLIEQGINDGTINITNATSSFGMLAGKNGTNRFGVSDNRTVGPSLMQNSRTGTININNSTNSAAFAVLQEIYAGNLGTINVTNSNQSAGFYSEAPLRYIGRGETTPNLGNFQTVSTNVNYGTINVSGGNGSAGLWMKNGGYADERGRVLVTGNGNIGLVAQNNSGLTELNNYYEIGYGNAKSFNYDPNQGIFVNNGTGSLGAYVESGSNLIVRGNGIFVGVNRSFGGFGGITTGINNSNPDSDSRGADGVSAIGNTTNSIGAYINASTLNVGDITNWYSERDYGRIITEGQGNHAVVAENGSNVSNLGLIQNNLNNTAVGTIGVSLNGSTFSMNNRGSIPADGVVNIASSGNNARILSGDGSLNVYATNGSTANIWSGVLQVGNTSGTNTAINIYKDASSVLNLGGGNYGLSMITGNNGVGIYTTDFFNVTINSSTTAKLGNNAVFSYLNGGSALSSQYSNLAIDSSSASDSTLIYAVNGNTLTFNNNMNLNNVNGVSMNVYSVNNANVVNASGNTLTTQDRNNNMLVAAANSGALGYTGSNAVAKATNYGTLDQNSSNGASIYTLFGTATNGAGGTINLNVAGTAGVFGDESSIVANDGIINITSAAANSVGLYGRDDNNSFSYGSNTINISNSSSGIINVDAVNSIGISANNTSKTVANSTISNTGTINVNSNNGIGIYTPYSTITNVGKIDLSGTPTGNNSVAVYAEKGNVVPMNTGDINLGTTNGQTQVAYYLKGTASTPTTPATPDPDVSTSTSLGTITGHGVGILIDDLEIDNNTFSGISGNKLDYTTAGTGNGIIGLYIKGDVDNSANELGFTGDIKVGKSITDTTVTPNRTDYAVALYTYGQGTSATPLTIKNNLEVGERGVGLFAANDSNLVYDTGTITVNTNGVGGTGIYVSEPTASGNTSKVYLKSDITTNGDNAAGVIVGQNGQFTFDANAAMTFNGSGVAMYGFKDSVINDMGGTISNPTGASVERIRTHGGRLDVLPSVTMTLPSGQILYHSENGQVNNDPTATITDGGTTGNGQIALYAEGHLDPTQTPYVSSLAVNPTGWNLASYDSKQYDGINQGNINLSASTTAVALYANSADVINDAGATITMGDSSVGVYGINNANISTTHGGTSAIASGNYTANVVNA